MRKLCFITLLIFAISIAVAQETTDFSHRPTSFGIKLGLDRTMLLTTEKTTGRTDFYAGVFAETRLSKRIGIHYEMRYSKFKNNNFVEIPLLFKYYFNDNWNIFIGPRMDFLIDDRESINSFTPSAEFGVQYNFSKHFFIEGTYSLSSENQIKIDDYLSGSRSNFRLGIGFKL